jgi:hypothetical protein
MSCRSVFFLLLLGISIQAVGQSPMKQSSEKPRIKSNGELTSRSIERNRRNFRYDNGGLSTCYLLVFGIKKDRESDPCGEKAVRDFIWNHYSAKKRGYIRVKYIDVDSASIEHFFIEPQKSGTWMIVWWSVDHFSQGLPGSPPFKIWAKKLLTAEMVENKQTGKSKLVLKTEDGIMLQGMPLVLNDY